MTDKTDAIPPISAPAMRAAKRIAAEAPLQIPEIARIIDAETEQLFLQEEFRSFLGRAKHVPDGVTERAAGLILGFLDKTTLLGLLPALKAVMDDTHFGYLECRTRDMVRAAITKATP